MLSLDRTRRTVSPIAALVLALACAGAQGSLRSRADDGYVDTAPHRVGFVTVARGVRLEYLDFGGTGEPLVLLAGIGNTAHAYDDFAPAFTDRFHVIAITRRGFGASSHPDTGYSIPVLAHDIKVVLDSLHLGRVDLVGHSFAGQEMTHFARAYPDRVAKLVYLDGAYDDAGVDSVAQLTFPSPIPYPTKPELTLKDTATLAAYVAYVHRSRGVNIPESDIRMRVKYDGVIEEAGKGYMAIAQQDRERQDWKTLKVPALAIFAVIDSVSQAEPWVRADAFYHDAVQSFLNRDTAVTHFAERDFAQAPHSKVFVVHGGHHWVFVSHKAIVIAAVRDFLLGP
jgi:non-heme chloroperoxidase